MFKIGKLTSKWEIFLDIKHVYRLADCLSNKMIYIPTIQKPEVKDQDFVPMQRNKIKYKILFPR